MTSTSFKVAREHGNSYLAIAEWTGFLGVAPFFILLALVIRNVVWVGAYMRRTADPHTFAVPLAAVVLAGFVNAGFEDWMFAVGYHTCVFFWMLALVLPDFTPHGPIVSRLWHYDALAVHGASRQESLSATPVIVPSHASIY